MHKLLNFRPKAEQAASRIPELKMLATQTAFHVLHGANPQRKAGSGESFWQFREYQQGDIPRDIDWRQSAKTDRVYIRQTEQHTAQTCLFWLKQNADMNFKFDGAPYTKKDAAGVIALTLALLHSRSGEMIGLADAQRPGHSEKTLENFERLLARETTQDLPEQIQVPRHASFYAASDFLEPLADIEAALSPLAARTRNGWLIQILDPAELDFPFSGRINFENMVGAEQTLINNAVDIQSEYQKRIKAHNDDLKALCNKIGWYFIQHRTDTPFKDTMMKIWLENTSKGERR